jgi:RNA polymerase sigma-70 factor (ECF subfamily)
MKPADHELVERIRQGDHQAFEALYGRHRERLYRHAFVHTRGRAAVAEEIVQDVFLSLFSGRAQPSENVAGFLLVSVRNRAINACQRREARADQVGLEGAPSLADGGQGPEAAADRREEAALLSEALLDLSPEQREVVLLRSYEGLPWKQVADLLGVPLPTASTRYRAALQQLRAACRSLSHA